MRPWLLVLPKLKQLKPRWKLRPKQRLRLRPRRRKPVTKRWSAAAIMHGTLGTQRVLVSGLAALPSRVEALHLGAPSTLIVGEVVRLRETLAWWEKEPLFGMRVLVTRAEDQAAELASALRTAGAEPVLVPMIALVPPDDPAALDLLDSAIERLSGYDGIVFASSNAVRFLAARASDLQHDLSEIRGQVFCVGQKTARTALDAGLPVHLVATGRSDAELIALTAP